MPIGTEQLLSLVVVLTLTVWAWLFVTQAITEKAEARRFKRRYLDGNVSSRYGSDTVSEPAPFRLSDHRPYVRRELSGRTKNAFRRLRVRAVSRSRHRDLPSSSH